MSKFQIGTQVLHLASGQHGTIVEVYPPRRGRQLYKVSWQGYISDELEVDLAQVVSLAHILNMLRKTQHLKSRIPTTVRYPLLKPQKLCSEHISLNHY